MDEDFKKLQLEVFRQVSQKELGESLEGSCLQKLKKLNNELLETFDLEEWSNQYDTYPEIASFMGVLFVASQSVVAQSIKLHSEKTKS